MSCRLIGWIVILLAAAACQPPALGQGGHGDSVVNKYNQLRRAYRQMLDQGYNVAAAEDLVIAAQAAFGDGDRGRAEQLLDEAGALLRDLKKKQPTLLPRPMDLETHAASFDLPTFPWSIAAADLNGDGKTEIVVGGMDDTVYAMSYPDMKVLWKVAVPGLPYRLELGDVDGDGKKEIACVALGPRGTVVLVSHDGKKLWTFETDDLVLSAAVCRGEVLAGGARLHRLDEKGRAQQSLDAGQSVIGSIAKADINADGADEIVIANQDEGLYVLDAQGRVLWKALGHVGGMKIASFAGIADTGRPGKKSVFFTKTRGIVKLYDGDGRAEWLQVASPTELFRAAPVTVTALAADVTGDGADEIVCHGGLRFRNSKHAVLLVYGRDGRRIHQAELPFPALSMAAADLDGNGKAEILFAAQQEKRLYTLSLSAGAGGAGNLASLPATAAVDANLDAIYEQVRALPDKPDEPVKYHAIYQVRLTGAEDADGIRNLWRFLKSQSKGALRLEIGLREIQEAGMEVSKAKSRVTALSTREIVKIARKLGEAGVYFYWGAASHAEQIFVRPETIEKMAQAAGEYFLGCFSYETCFAMSGSRNRKRYLDFLEKAVAVCHRNGMKYLITEPLDTWLFLPANKNFYERILEPHKGTVVPVYKGNEGRCPELAIGGLVGLYRSGAIEEWGVSAQDDMFRLGCYTDLIFQCPQDVKLRLDLACAALGATYFRIEWQMETDNYATRDPERYDYRKGGPYQLNPNARHHRELLYSLIRKGVIAPPAPDALAGVSPATIRLDPVPDGFSFDAKRRKYVTENGFLGRWQYPLQKPYPGYASVVLYGLERYGLGFFPRNPYGTVAVVPSFLHGGGPSVGTGGRSVVVDGKALTPDEAAPAVRALFEKHAAGLPFRAAGAFLAAQKTGDGEYLLFLIDPEPFRPEDVRCSVQAGAAISGCRMVDAITGESIRCENGKASIDVPAGAFRLIRVTTN